MAISTLQKCLKELDADKPRLDYIRGMLETLVEMDATHSTTQTFKPEHISPNGVLTKEKLERAINKNETDEGEILDAKAKAHISSVRELSDKGTDWV